MALLSSTLVTMRQGLLDYLGFTYRGTTTADGGTAGATFIDTTNLKDYSNNKFQNWWALITSGTYSGQVRRVSSSTQSTGTITPVVAFGGVIVSGVTYELTPYHPTNDLRWALNKAGRECPEVHISLVNEDLVTGNILPNGSFEDFIASASVPDFWALVGDSSAKNTSVRRYGKAAVSVTRSGADSYIHCSDTQWRPLLDLGGYTPYFEAWVYCATASVARLGISVDGGTPTYSSYHTGSSKWELLRVSKVITDSPKSLSFRCYVDTSNAIGYFDYARILSDNITAYVIPGVFQSKPPTQVWVQKEGTAHGDESSCDDLGEVLAYEEWPWVRFEYDDDNGLWLMRITRRPDTGLKIRLVGVKPPDEVTNDTDTVSLDLPELDLLYSWAAWRLHRHLSQQTSSPAEYLTKAAVNWEDYVRLRNHLGQPKPPPMLDYGRWK